jgi:LytS/YehU family sensor histidine kinase
MSFKFLFSTNTENFIRFSIFPLVFWYYRRVLIIQSELEKAKTTSIILAKEKIEAEYNFLKTQINPHFLYNTLSMFYNQTQATLPKTAEGILLLTDIMRYSLNTGDKRAGKVLLEDEIEQLYNYIALQQLRYNNGMQIKVTVSGNTMQLYIVPHIFLTFVENAIKYGDTHNASHPVSIIIEVTSTHLLFNCTNLLSPSVKDSPGTGIGIANAANRLHLQYGDSLQFTYGEIQDIYKVAYSIKLMKDMY